MTMKKCDVVIIGAGPAGIFTALELIKNGSKKKIILVEQGKSMEQRKCPKEQTNKCMNCKPYCDITTGFSGAGAFSDGKLSLSYEVGGELPKLVGVSNVQSLIGYTDQIYLDFGADTKVEGIGQEEKVKEIRKKAIKAGLKLVDCPIRHLGTEKAQEIYGKIQAYLVENGVEILFGYTCLDANVKEDVCYGVEIEHTKTHETVNIEAKKTVIATGRKGADWLEKLCTKKGVNHVPGTVDVGVRVEVRNEIMEEVNNVLYESKLIGYPAPFKNKVRTFCQNPGGFVSQENYDNDLAIVNGHSYKERKSDNTNLAILCSHNFRVPFDQPIEYAKRIGELTNMLANGQILVQRFGDILEGKRTWKEELERSNVRPTLPDAIAGDITSALSYRTMMNIINFIKAVDQVVPGFAATETLLYAPEIKFYSNRVKLDENLNTNIENFYCLGDSSGWTRGLMMASVMGVIMGRQLA
ncbi:MAG: NAD(P)/FAD-dependent oxidoreductase [Velocimicrobium sp.]